MRIITFDDIIETYVKIYHRGFRYLFTKLSFSSNRRAKSSFNATSIDSANYWIIPRVRQRWNKLISGNESVSYEDYVVEKYLKGRSGLNLLSLGCGTCSHEMIFARHHCFQLVKCVDFSDKTLGVAEDQANALGLTNMLFECADVNGIQIPPSTYDVVLFHSSLHHFRNIPDLLQKVKGVLRSGGVLILNEYVGPNRLQITKGQLKAINEVLRTCIPREYKRRFLTNIYKEKVWGSGLIRMFVTDPSEAVESEGIEPAINAYFNVIEEKRQGGDLLMWVFKDISHNFLQDNDETNRVLDNVFRFEDDFLSRNDASFVFGIYSPKSSDDE